MITITYLRTDCQKVNQNYTTKMISSSFCLYKCVCICRTTWDYFILPHRILNTHTHTQWKVDLDQEFIISNYIVNIFTPHGLSCNTFVLFTNQFVLSLLPVFVWLLIIVSKDFSQFLDTPPPPTAAFNSHVGPSQIKLNPRPQLCAHTSFKHHISKNTLGCNRG